MDELPGGIQGKRRPLIAQTDDSDSLYSLNIIQLEFGSVQSLAGVN